MSCVKKLAAMIPAWAAVQQADDQKIAPGDAHKEFMKNCINSAKSTAPAAS